MERSLREMRIRGVKTNIPFLINVMRNKNLEAVIIQLNLLRKHLNYLIYNRHWIGNKTLEYIGNVTINGFPNVQQRPKPDYETTSIPRIAKKQINSLSGTKQLLDQHGPNHVAQWVRQQDDVLITDTTLEMHINLS